LSEDNQQILFYWTNFTSPGYNNSNLTIFLRNKKHKISWTISFDPKLSQGNCSVKECELQSGTENNITATITKVVKNFSIHKNGTCSIKTGKGIIFIIKYRCSP
jgi:hypothetical protein